MFYCPLIILKLRIIKLVINLLIADDHEIVRSGYCRLFEATGLYQIIGEASSGKEAVSLFKELKPDVLILDILMSDMNGIDVIKYIKTYQKSAVILVVTLYDHTSLVERCLKLGALGFVTKKSTGATLIAALANVFKNKPFISPDIAHVLAIKNFNFTTSLLSSSLTPREFDIFIRIAKGESISDISKEIFLSKRTVSNYSSIIKNKLNVTTTASFVHIAFQEGLIPYYP